MPNGLRELFEFGGGSRATLCSGIQRVLSNVIQTYPNVMEGPVEDQMAKEPADKGS